MENNSIGVYARMKPTNSKASDYKISKTNSSDIITFKRVVGSDTNKPTPYSFRFNKIFETFTNQSEIFAFVAKPVVDRVLQGYNGTIMAYGQTGSGKTYTITGGSKTYDERGIVPRTLQYLYSKFQEAEAVYTVHISYLEIYNECGYDLLTSKSDLEKLEDYPRVIVLEDAHQKCHIRNLSLQSANDEGEALDLLFLGDTNRSERASKVGLNGVTLREAKSINRSLHFLERVTAALADTSRNNTSSNHVPYRNSLLTNILRDSLGGNCLTTFVITLASDASFLPKEDASKIDQHGENSVLHWNKGENNYLYEELPQKVKEECKRKVEKFIFEENSHDTKIVETILDVGSDPRCIQLCFQLLRKYLQDERDRYKSERCCTDTPEILQCRQRIQERDNEISILINLLQEEKLKSMNKNSSEKVPSKIYVDCNKGQPATPFKITEMTDESQKSYQYSLYKGTSDEEQLAFKAFIEAGGIGEVLQKEVEERNQMLIAKCNEANQMAHELQSRRETIISLGQKLNESNEFTGCWHSQTSKQELRENTIQLQENITSKITGSSIDLAEVMEVELKKEQEAYKHALTKLQQLKSETNYLNQSLKQAEVQLKLQFKFYWDRIQTSAVEKGILAPTQVEFCDLDSGITENTAHMYPHDPNWPAHLINSKSQRFESNPSLNMLQKDNLHSPALLSPPINPNVISSSYYLHTPNPSPCMHTPNNTKAMQTNHPPCCIQTSNPSIYLATPNSSLYATTSNPLCSIPSPNRACNMSPPKQTSNPSIYLATPNSSLYATSNPLCSIPSPNRACNMSPPNQSNISTLNPLCHYKTPDQRFNKCEFKDACTKSKILMENESSTESWYPLKAYKSDMRQAFDCISSHRSENNSKNDRLPGTNSNYNHLPNSIHTPNEKLIQSSEGRITSDHQHASKRPPYFYNSEKNRYSNPEVSQENNQLAGATTSAQNVYSYNKLPLTGDKEVDEEILAFYRARNRILDKNYQTS